jgi:hypothetical protein
VRFTITPPGAGRAVGRIVDAMVAISNPAPANPRTPGAGGQRDGRAGPAHYYTDSGKEPRGPRRD